MACNLGYPSPLGIVRERYGIFGVRPRPLDASRTLLMLARGARGADDENPAAVAAMGSVRCHSYSLAFLVLFVRSGRQF